MSVLVVKNIFQAIDKVSGVAKQIGNRVVAFTKKVGKALTKFRKKTKKSTGSLKKFFKVMAAAAVILFFTRQVKAAVLVGAEFEKTLDSVAAKFGDISPKKLEELGAVARKVGAETEFSTTQAAKGLDFLAQAGFNADQSIAALPQVVDLATVANLDLARATDIASDTLGAFNLMTKNSIKLTENLSRVNDVMAKTVTSSNTNMELLFETFTKVGPVATAAGASIETVSTLAAKLADAGIKGSKAGIDLKNVFLRLTAPTKEASDMMERLGLNVADSEGNVRDIIDIFDDLGKSIGKKGAAEQLAILNKIFGKIPIASVNVLLKAGTKNLKDFRTELENANGSAKQMATIMRDNLAGQIKALKSRFEAVQITTFKILAPVTKRAFTQLTKLTVAAEKFLRVNEKIIQSGIDKALNKAREAASLLFRAYDSINQEVNFSAAAVKIWQAVKDIIGSLVPILFSIVALIKIFINKFKEVKFLDVVLNFFKEIAKLIDFLVIKIVEFVKHLDKVGALGFLVQGFKLIVNLARLLMVLVRPLASIFFGIAKAILTLFTPIFKGFELLFKGINKIFDFVDKKRDKDNDPGNFPTKLISPTENLIESKNIEIERSFSQIDVNFNGAPKGTEIREKGDTGKRLNLNLGSQPARGPGV